VGADLSHPAETPRDESTSGRPPSKALPVERLLVNADQAAVMSGVSPATWFRLKAKGQTPPAVKLGGRVLYRVEDLRLWVSLGCPPRKEFEARKAAARGP
jgi:predicted DNA-binding transcriptional regulator AlpA